MLQTLSPLPPSAVSTPGKEGLWGLLGAGSAGGHAPPFPEGSPSPPGLKQPQSQRRSGKGGGEVEQSLGPCRLALRLHYRKRRQRQPSIHSGSLRRPRSPCNPESRSEPSSQPRVPFPLALTAGPGVLLGLLRPPSRPGQAGLELRRTATGRGTRVLLLAPRPCSQPTGTTMGAPAAE